MSLFSFCSCMAFRNRRHSAGRRFSKSPDQISERSISRLMAFRSMTSCSDLLASVVIAVSFYVDADF